MLRYLSYFTSKAHADSPNLTKDVHDVIVIGSGLVGMSSALHLSILPNNKPISLLSLDSLPRAASSPASSGNSGLGHTGYDAPISSLERRLLRRSIMLHPHLYRKFGLSFNHVNKSSGSLVCAKENAKELRGVIAENKIAGDEEVVLLNTNFEVDAHLGDDFSHKKIPAAVYCPREAIVEPWLVAMGYQAMLSSLKNVESVHGRGGEVVAITKNEESNLWEVKTKDGETHRGVVVVNAAGLFADKIDAMAMRRGGNCDTFTVKPRKGQFLVLEPTTPEAAAGAPKVIFEQVPNSKTKGVIVWTTVWGNVVIGPTADDVDDRYDVSTDADVLSRLEGEGARVLGARSMSEMKVVGSYSGLRPATDRRDYIIKAEVDNWITAASVRSTGLSASPAIGEYVAELYNANFGQSVGSDAKRLFDLLGEGGVDERKLRGITASALSNRALGDESNYQYLPNLEPVPTLEELKRDFKARGDGKVTVWGQAWQVTHPISIFGMSRK